MESRAAYGWGGSGVNSVKTMEKWQVSYRTDDGGFGIVGYKLFNTRSAAEDFAKNFQKENSWVKEVFVSHPAKRYSTY